MWYFPDQGSNLYSRIDRRSLPLDHQEVPSWSFDLFFVCFLFRNNFQSITLLRYLIPNAKKKKKKSSDSSKFSWLDRCLLCCTLGQPEHDNMASLFLHILSPTHVNNWKRKHHAQTKKLPTISPLSICFSGKGNHIIYYMHGEWISIACPQTMRFMC